jgi:hypothetical protein
MSQQPQVDQESQNGHSETFATQHSLDATNRRVDDQGQRIQPREQYGEVANTD